MSEFEKNNLQLEDNEFCLVKKIYREKCMRFVISKESIF